MENKKKVSFQMLMLITTPKLAERAEEMFREDRLPLLYRFKAEGTVSSEIMNMLGLDSVEKRVLVSALPKMMADVMLEKLKIGKRLNRGGSAELVSCAEQLGSGNSQA